jgi:hypothetical protein
MVALRGLRASVFAAISKKEASIDGQEEAKDKGGNKKVRPTWKSCQKGHPRQPRQGEGHRLVETASAEEERHLGVAGMDDKRKGTNDSDHVRKDSDDRRIIKEDHGTKVTDWHRPPRPDKEKQKDQDNE